MLHYNPQHVTSSTLLIFRRTNCIITTTSGIALSVNGLTVPAYCKAVYRDWRYQRL